MADDMQPTFYGLDIKLHPGATLEQPAQEIGTVIEMGGFNCGSSFHRVGNSSFYERVMQEFGQSAGGKKILLSYMPSHRLHLRPETRPLHTDRRLIQDWREMLRNYPKGLVIDEQHIWDGIDWEREAKKTHYARREPFLLQAGKKLGLDISPYVSLRVSNDIVFYETMVLDPEFEKSLPEDLSLPGFWDLGRPLPYKLEKRVVHMDDIGLILTTDNVGGIEDFFGSERVINGEFAETLLANKATHYMFSGGIPIEGKPLELYPDTYINIPGYEPISLTEWLDDFPDDKIFVKKPLNRAHGIGVEFLTREEIQERFGSGILPEDKEDKAHALIEFVIQTCYRREENNYSVLFQNMIEGKEVSDEEGNSHDVTARAIVVNGKYMGAIWRTGAEGDGDIGDRLRHNITNGGSALAVSKEDDKLLEKVALQAASMFDTQVNISRKKLDGDVDQLDLVRDGMYMMHVNACADREGINLIGGVENWLKENGIKDYESVAAMITERERWQELKEEEDVTVEKEDWKEEIIVTLKTEIQEAIVREKE